MDAQSYRHTRKTDAHLDALKNEHRQADAHAELCKNGCTQMDAHPGAHKMDAHIHM